MIRRVKHLLEMIRFSHTLFALPFALLSAALAWHTKEAGFSWLELLGILLCLVFARSAAMAFNRLADRAIDAANPRTAGRHLPAGKLSVASVWAFTLFCVLAFTGSTALFLLAECQFFTDDYPEANDTYTNLLKKYQNTRHLDKVMNRQFAIARYWQEYDRARPAAFLEPNVTDKSRPWLDTPGNALATYESVRLNDPTGPLADDSVMATANAHFLDDRYMDADYYYGILRSESCRAPCWSRNSGQATPTPCCSRASTSVSIEPGSGRVSGLASR